MKIYVSYNKIYFTPYRFIGGGSLLLMCHRQRGQLSVDLLELLCCQEIVQPSAIVQPPRVAQSCAQRQAQCIELRFIEGLEGLVRHPTVYRVDLCQPFLGMETYEGPANSDPPYTRGANRSSLEREFEAIASSEALPTLICSSSTLMGL